MGNKSSHYQYKQTTLPPYKPVATLQDENLRIHYLTKYSSELNDAVPYREKKLKKGKLRKKGVNRKIKELNFKRAQQSAQRASTVNYGADRYVIVAADGSRAAKEVRPISNKNDRVWFVKREEVKETAVQPFEFDDESTETMSMMETSRPQDEKLAREEALEEELYRMCGYDKEGNKLVEEEPKDPEEPIEEDTLPAEEDGEGSEADKVLEQTTPAGEVESAEETPGNHDLNENVEETPSGETPDEIVVSSEDNEEQTPGNMGDASEESPEENAVSEEPADSAVNLDAEVTNEEPSQENLETPQSNDLSEEEQIPADDKPPSAGPQESGNEVPASSRSAKTDGSHAEEAPADENASQARAEEPPADENTSQANAEEADEEPKDELERQIEAFDESKKQEEEQIAEAAAKMEKKESKVDIDGQLDEVLEQAKQEAVKTNEEVTEEEVTDDDEPE